ncbi:MAG TPA: class I SAM-dependent methyltransferase [Xanthobacteraceae bacterium]|nr:class I SAM-dependent methyltransferase [Xanthobacteraceae bacterium]
MLAPFKSGIAAADAYIGQHYFSVPGMSSRFAAAVGAATMRIQSEQGIAGHFVEIGAFAGRYFIALSHALTGDERAIGFDTFHWPSPKVKTALEDNIAKYGVPGRSIIVAADSLKLSAKEILALATGKKVRFFHVDGEHTPEHLANDMSLATQTLDERGVICLDDMLHAGYPTLPVIVHEFLKREPSLRVFCVIDREDIAAQTKYMICREPMFDFYIGQLLKAFPDNVWPLGADFRYEKKALVLSPDPKLPNFDDLL